MNELVFSVEREDVPLILSGKKTALIAKKMPKDLVFPVKIFLYEKKGRLKNFTNISYTKYGYEGRGTIVGECFCEAVEKGDANQLCKFSNQLKMTCKQICEYLNGVPGCVFKITNATPYEKEIRLEDFEKKTPPQAWYFAKRSKRNDQKNDCT